MDCLDRVQREGLLRGAVLAGDENAWRWWYEETFDDLHAYVRWRCGGRGDWADEIVQETWLTAVRRIRRFDPSQGSFLVWLRGIAANILRNDLRRQRRHPEIHQPADGLIAEAGPDPSLEEQRLREQRVAAALFVLAEREEAVLRAKYLEGLSVAEIAATRDETPKAVESLLSRARRAFRNAYRGQGDEHGNA